MNNGNILHGRGSTVGAAGTGSLDARCVPREFRGEGSGSVDRILGSDYSRAITMPERSRAGENALAFVIVAIVAGVISLAGAAVAGYMAVLTRRARALGARWVPVPMTGRQLDAPSPIVLGVFSAAFAVLGVLLIASALAGW